MNRMLRKFVMLVVLALFQCGMSGTVPKPVWDLLAEMKECGASVRGGYDSSIGVFFVGIGRTCYRPGAVNKSREIAQMNAVKAVSEALGQAFRARDTVSLQLSAKNDSSEAKAFVSAITESSINQLMKGVQVICSGKKSNDEMEVAVYVTSKMSDYSSIFQEFQGQWGGSGVVKAVGMGGDRRIAEMNAAVSMICAADWSISL